MAKNGILALVILSICHIFSNVDAFAASAWYQATATFYGGADAAGTMSGACGYGNTYVAGYGVMTTALSSALFNNGLSCGNCYRIVCNYAQNPTRCIKNVGVTVTAVDNCPQGSYGGWCDWPRSHFDMSEPAWLNIGIYSGGIIPVVYQRVKCVRHGGMRFTINGNPWFNLVLISNVGQAGSIIAISMKATNTNWMTMSRNWGVNWQSGTDVVGYSLSFRVTSSSGVVVQCLNIVPSNWVFGQTFSAANCQFSY